MVTKSERQRARTEVAKRMREHADMVHSLAVLVPFWRVDDTGDQIVMRDMEGHLLVTFHGSHGVEMAKWLTLMGRTSGMALADVIRVCSGSEEHLPGRDPALRMLQEMHLEPKPTRYRR
jgi:hypothetical protein